MAVSGTAMKRMTDKRIGVLALQGDYEAHLAQLESIHVPNRLVRLPGDLAEIDALIIPGGETTTMDILMDRFALREPLVQFGRTHAVYGTCAGMIMLSSAIDDNQSCVKPLGLMDISVLRNGYGRQIYSFENSVEADFGKGPVRLTATFIRAPKVTRTGPGVRVLATYHGDPVLLRENNLLAGAFHTELDEDTTLLEYFLTEFD
jgi:pyridoxal 5'-phosphate synthase pdxT subunit